MALSAFLTLGGIKGSARQKGREGKSHVNSVTHEIISKANPKTGLPEETRKHGYLVVTKDIDQASPLIHLAHTANAVLKSFELQFWRMPPGGGQEENFYTIKLTGAKVATYKTTMPNLKIQALASMAEYEEIGFSYDEIEWSYKGADGGQSGKDTSTFFIDSWASFLDEKAEMIVKAGASEIAGAVKNALKGAATKEAASPDAPKAP